MQKLNPIIISLVLAFLVTACAGNTSAPPDQIIPTATHPGLTPTIPAAPTANCPITVPPTPAFTPPAPYDALVSFKDHFWHGSNSLWTTLPVDGIWGALPHNAQGYTQKILWWRDGYVWNEEPEPNLIVHGKRLDASAPPLISSKATNAFASDIGSAMLVGVDFPTLGCWKITGNYNGTELSFTIWVQE